MKKEVPRVVHAVTYILEAVTLLESLPVEPYHVLVGLEGDYVKNELSCELTTRVFLHVFLPEITANILEEAVDVEVL